MKNILFIDRDGTLISEPPTDFQVDSFEKFALETDVIPALLALQTAGFELIMVTNQDGLGTDSFPMATFQGPHHLLMHILTSQGIHFRQVFVCPHLPNQGCQCRKPQIGLVADYLATNSINPQRSYVIGDRQTDMSFANNLGIRGIQYHPQHMSWSTIVSELTVPQRTATVNRQTAETGIQVSLNLDQQGNNYIATGIHFFDHMLMQIATHSGINMTITATGDLHIDDHHSIEDTGLALGEALKLALGDKWGIGRFGFVLPMDECLANCSLDLSGRPYLVYQATFNHQRVGDMSTEMIEHFFHSLSYSLACTLHLSTEGKNDHHKAESLFKAFGRCLRQAIKVDGNQLPSSKGIL